MCNPVYIDVPGITSVTISYLVPYESSVARISGRSTPPETKN